MTTAAPPSPAPSPNQSGSKALKAFIAGAALLSTLATAVINGCVNQHFAAAQNDASMRKEDVRKLDAMIDDSDKLTRIFVDEVLGGKISEKTKKELRDSLLRQYSYIDTLRGIVGSEKDVATLRSYQSQIVLINKLLRDSVDVPSTIKFGQAVSHGIDLRIAASNTLKSAVGLPIEKDDPSLREPVSNFGGAG